MDDEIQSLSDDGVQSYSVSLSLDRDHFFRRACPNCGLEFKTIASDADINWLLANEVQRSTDFVEIVKPKHDGSPTIECPYCENSAESTQMQTEETVQYLQRFAFREIVLPMFEQAFEGLDSRPKSGLISLSLSFDQGVKPVRPIHGPEPPDMAIIDLQCCGEQIKVRNLWIEIGRCPFCRTAIQIDC